MRAHRLSILWQHYVTGLTNLFLPAGVNLIGDSLDALLRHHPKTLIGLPIGGLMIWYLVKRNR